MTCRSIHKHSDLLWIIAFSFLVACIHSYFALLHLEAKIALNSFSLLDYGNHKLYPENFVRDWPNGIMEFSLSAPIVIVTWLHQVTGIDLLFVLRSAAFFQLFLVSVSIGCLSQTIHKEILVTLIYIALCFISSLTFLDLARFGNGIGTITRYNLQWGYAISFSFFSLNAFLTRRYWLSLFSLVVSMYCHLTIGFFTFLFILPSILFNLKTFDLKKASTYLLVFSALFAPYIKMLSTHNVSGADFPVELYVKILQIFSFHHFPVVMNCFDRRAGKEFLPIVFSLILFFTLVRSYVKSSKEDKIIHTGVITSLFLTVCYLLFSEVWPLALVIKLQLHRMSYFITFFSTMYVIAFLIREARRGFFLAVLSSIIVSLLFFSIPGMPLIPLFIIVLFRVNIRLETKLVMLLGILLTIGYYYKIHAVSIGNFVFGKGFWVNYYVLSVFLLAVLIVLLLSTKKSTWAVPLLMVVLTLSTGLIEYHKETNWIERHLGQGEAYKAVQQWAQINSSPTSLFLVDPSWGYGWRDFSKRSKFGSIREWLYTPVSQEQDFNLFIKGIERANDFGVNFQSISQDEIYAPDRFHYGSELINIVRNKFYSLSGSELQKICKKYGIDYVVMRKKYLKDNKKILDSSMTKVYINDFFVVYKLL